jgi:cAMP-dependent protein kinase regulator
MARTSLKPLTPATALDHALEGLAQDDPGSTLRHALPALEDPDTRAAAADLCGRALLMAGERELATGFFRKAVGLLIERALVPHAVAAAIALRELGEGEEPAHRIARAFGAGAPEGGPARPPSLSHSRLAPLDASISRKELFAAARKALATLADGQGPGAHPRYALWSALPEDAFVRFVRALSVRTVAEGGALIREGEPGESAFVLARGEVRVLRGTGDDTEELAALGAGSIVGEMALVTDAPRAASVYAVHALLVLEAPRAALDEAAAEVPALGEQVVAFFHKRLVDNMLRTSPVLSELPHAERDGLAALFETRAFDAGTQLITEGEETPGLFLIAAGRFAVTRGQGAEALRLASLGPGMCVGEIGLALRRPATASVVAESHGVALCLPAAGFRDVVRDRPTLFSRLYDLAVQREDETRSVLAAPSEEIDEVLI